MVRTENANKPHRFGLIDANNFSPFPKNPAISKFFREIGFADELGSGVKNVNKYLKIYSGGEHEFIEEDIFKQILPISEQLIEQSSPAETPQKTRKIYLQLFLFFAVNREHA